ncbi:MAG: glycosyltransferase family 4 protein [Gaiellaceae bacterium]
MKVAYYSPMPPDRSGISDYSELLLPALRERVDVEVARKGRPARGDVALYHIGNNPESHAWIVEQLRRRPGVVVLHDFVLHHLVAGMTLGHKDGPGYLAAMERDAGIAGRLLGLGVIDGCIPPLWEVRPEDFPLCGEVLDLATGVIVHSHYVEERVRARFAGPVWHIPHPAWHAPEVAPVRIEGDPVVGAFGNMNPSKRVPQLLDAFERFRVSQPNARLLLVGAAAPGFDLEWRVAHEGLRGAVVQEDYVDEERLWALMAGVDVVASLRSPTMGETSGTAIRALTLGKPLLVSDVGWFSELPDSVAVKAAVDDREADRLAEGLERLADPAVRIEMGEAARALAHDLHDVARVADLYAAALEETLGGESVRDSVLREVSEAAAEVGIAATSSEAAALGEALDEVQL